VEVQLSPEDRARLERRVTDRNAPRKHAWRTRVVLLRGDGIVTMEIVRREIMRRIGQPRPTVWRWRSRFAAEGVADLLHDTMRAPGRKPLPASVVQQVVTTTTTETPPAATHWTAQAMARALGITVSSGRRSGRRMG
jgi:hypothetical protein